MQGSSPLLFRRTIAAKTYAAELKPNSWLYCLFFLQIENIKYLKVANITFLMWNSEYRHPIFVY